MGASTGIAWTTSPRPTLGVELELQVVDAETGDLVSLANEILADVGAGHPEGEHPKAKHEKVPAAGRTALGRGAAP